LCANGRLVGGYPPGVVSLDSHGLDALFVHNQQDLTAIFDHFVAKLIGGRQNFSEIDQEKALRCKIIPGHKKVIYQVTNAKIRCQCQFMCGSVPMGSKGYDQLWQFYCSFVNNMNDAPFC